MRISYNWLQEYIKLNVDADDLGKKYTSAGLELDEVISVGEGLDKVVVARVLSCDPVSGSDHLHLCSVDVGGERPLTIICGAPNVAAGRLVACAMIGAVLPGGFAISARQTFGVLSEGMLCSCQELGLSDDHSGIWLLDDIFVGQEVPLGAELADVLNLRDRVLLVELTPNRSDCLGMINCAREAAAVAGGEVKLPELDYAENGANAADDIAINVMDHKLCPRYDARVVKNIKIGPSPLWMQNYLRAAGMRPINNVVDISNFVMLEMNQPLHTFDLKQIKDKTIVVRAAHAGETMQTLDGKERVFVGDEILICDGSAGERPVCVAGVMGGMATEVTTETTDILIESACFDPVSIRKAARRLGIPSEASLRFEKGLDAANCDTAARRAAQLLVEYCGGTADKGAVDVVAPEYANGFAERVIRLRPARVNHILGTSFSAVEITDVMRRLSFGVTAEAEALLVTVPSYRQDISLEVDLIEEVARLKGFDLIPQTMPINATQGGRSKRQTLRLELQKLCASLGLYETVNYSFISPREANRLCLPAEHDWRRVLEVANPLSEEQSVMRRTLLPGLLNTAARNMSRRNLDVRLFETGMLFVPAAENITATQPTEVPALGMVMAGARQKDWLNPGGEYCFMQMKGIVESVFAAFGVDDITYKRSTEHSFLHPGRAAAICLNGAPIGILGELHPLVAENYELSGRVVVAEIYLNELFSVSLACGNQPHDLPKYPASTRDIAVIGPADIPASQIEATICAAGGEYLRQVRLFDLYDKAPIPEGQRSLAYALEFRADEGTLTDAEVDEAFSAIVAALAEKYSYQLR